MLSGGPTRASPGSIPHGGTLLPKYTNSALPASCSASRGCRGRFASDLAKVATNISLQQAGRRRPSRPRSDTCASVGQPGPQDDGCKCGPSQPSPQHQSHAESSNAPSDPVSSQPGQPWRSHKRSGAASAREQQDPDPDLTQGLDPTQLISSTTTPVGSGGPRATPGDAADVGLNGRTVSASSGDGGPGSAVVNTQLPDHQQSGRKRQAQQQQQEQQQEEETEHGAQEHGYLQYPQQTPPSHHNQGPQLHQQQQELPVHAQAPEGQSHTHHLNGASVPKVEADDGGSSTVSSSSVGGVGGGAGAGSQWMLPPLRLDFLDLSGLKASGLPSNSERGPTGKSGKPPQSHQAGNARRRRRGISGVASPQSRDERIRQLINASKTLVQLRMVCQRHMPHMSAATAAVGLSRLAGLSAAISRLRKAQMRTGGAESVVEGLTKQAADAAAASGSSSSPLSSSSLVAAAVNTAAGAQGLYGASAALPVAEAEAVAGTGTGESLGGSVAASADAAAAPSTSVPAPPTSPSAATPSTFVPASSAPPSAASSVPSPSPSAASSAASASGASAAAGAGSAAADEASRSGHGSTKGVMRRMLLHIAACVGPSGSEWASGAVRRTSTLQPPPPLRFTAPNHRAWVLATVLGGLTCGGFMPVKEDRQALLDIVESARPDLFLATPSQLARIASSLPALHLRPSAAWVDHFCAVSRSKMYAARPEHLAAYVWCLAKLGHHPGDLWLYTLCDHFCRQGRFVTLTAGHMCQALWGLHRLGFQPDPEWREACAAAVLATMTAALSAAAPAAAAAAGAQAVPGSGVAAGSDRDGDDDGDGVPFDLYGSSDEELYGSSEEEHDGDGGGHGDVVTAVVAAREAGGSPVREAASLLLWAVRLGTAPSPAGLQVLLDKFQPQLRSLRRFHLTRLLLAMSEGGYKPSGEFMGAVLSCLQPKLALLGAKQLTQCLLAVSQLRYVPSQPWLVAFLKASRAQLRFYGPSHVTVTYQVFAGWQVRPPRPYLEDLHSYVDGLLPAFSTRGLATVLNAMSCLGIKPQRRWVARALEVVVQSATRKGAATPGTAAAVTTGGSAAAAPSPVSGAAAAAAPPPPLPWSRSPGATRRAPREPSAAPHPPPPPLPLRQPQQQQGPSVTAALVMAACSLRGIVHLDADGNSPKAATAAAFSGGVGVGVGSGGGAVAGQTAEKATAVAAAEGAEVADATAEAPVLLPYELWGGVKQLTDLCRELLDDMSASELNRLVHALSRINFYPGRDFLEEHSRAVSRVGSHLQPSDKAAVAQCYSRLVALAPLMAAESRRQSELRMSRAAVLMGQELGGLE